LEDDGVYPIINANPATKKNTVQVVAVDKLLLPTSSDTPQMSTISIQIWRDLLIPNQSLSTCQASAEEEMANNTSTPLPFRLCSLGVGPYSTSI
jgi:hypothetical protein